jgi:hypothetical protein
MRFVAVMFVYGCTATLGLLVALGAGCSETKSDFSGGLDGGEDGGQCLTVEGCMSSEVTFASFCMSCAMDLFTVTDLTGVTLSGPCAMGDGALGNYTLGPPFETPCISVGSPSPGVCHVELNFATGFTYSTNVTFTSQTLEVPRGCPACPPFIGPTGLPSDPISVNNPSMTCVSSYSGPSDAASDARREAAVDGGCACPSGGDGGVCVCQHFSMPACPSSASYGSGPCVYSGSCMGCSENSGFECTCADAGVPGMDGGGPQWLCIPTEEACTGGNPVKGSADASSEAAVDAQTE